LLHSDLNFHHRGIFSES